MTLLYESSQLPKRRKYNVEGVSQKTGLGREHHAMPPVWTNGTMESGGVYGRKTTIDTPGLEFCERDDG